MQLEAREQLVIKGEMESLKNVLKKALKLPLSDPKDFFTLLTEFKTRNRTITPAQTAVLSDLEYEYTERDKLITAFDAVISGAITTRMNILVIIGGLKTDHAFALFISSAKIELMVDTRTLSYASHAANIFD